jgi:hypothetical protein
VVDMRFFKFQAHLIMRNAKMVKCEDAGSRSMLYSKLNLRDVDIVWSRED